MAGLEIGWTPTPKRFTGQCHLGVPCLRYQSKGIFLAHNVSQFDKSLESLYDIEGILFKSAVIQNYWKGYRINWMSQDVKIVRP